MEDKRWSIMVGLVLLGLNTVICWISVLGFFGVQVIAIDSANTFQVYTYPNMMGLNVLPFGIMFFSILMAWVGWGKYMKRVAAQHTQGTIKTPVKTNTYWEQ